MVDYLEFYDTKVRPELIHFTQEFRRTVSDISAYLALDSSDELPSTIESLLKFSIRYQVSVQLITVDKQLFFCRTSSPR